jgi:hypothetical protein
VAGGEFRGDVLEDSGPWNDTPKQRLYRLWNFREDAAVADLEVNVITSEKGVQRKIGQELHAAP